MSNIDLDSETLELVNKVFGHFGISMQRENTEIVPYYKGERLKNAGKGISQVRYREGLDVYELPRIPYTQGLRVRNLNSDRTMELVNPDRSYWADNWEIVVDNNPWVWGDEHQMHNIDGPKPALRLTFENIMPNPHSFEVQLAQNDVDNSFMPYFKSHSILYTDKDQLMTIVFANKRAIIVERDKVLIGKDVDWLFDEEDAPYTEIPYSSYEELESILETAVEGLLNGKWFNPDQKDLSGNSGVAWISRVIREFLLSEIKRNVDHLKAKDTVIEGVVQKVKTDNK